MESKANKNRICFLISSISQAGGTGRVCAIISNKLAQLGYDVTVVSFFGEHSYFALEHTVKTQMLFQRRYPFKLILPYVVIKLRSVIKKAKPDFLINVDTALFPYSYYSSLGLKFKNIAWEHFNFNVTLNAGIRVYGRKLAAKYAACVITLTEKDKQNWLQNLHCQAPVVAVSNPSPFGVEEIDFSRKQKIVIAVGRLTHQKGFDRLIQIWNSVLTSVPDGWELHIVGSGELEGALKSQIKSFNLTSSVHIIPANNHIQTNYDTASIYCMTSNYEGFPMVLLEAQNFGLPLISFDVETGPAEIIKDNGFLIKDGDNNAFADALLELIKNEEKRIEMGQKSLKYADNYLVDNVIKHWIKLFNHLN